MGDRGPTLNIRRSRPADAAAVLALLEASMGWIPDELSSRFFTWKHLENPFGPSPAWVAIDDTDGDRIVGFRTLLRWEFVDRGEPVRAARAVDTATHPEYQGLGVFSRLTRTAIEDLGADRVSFIFNTPNQQSLPGYLKMGWREVGRLPIAALPGSVSALPRIVRARTAADKWSLASDAGVPASEVFADPAASRALLQHIRLPVGLITHRTPEYLSWRYGFEPLAYRAVLAGTSLEEGVAVFRLRQRGGATEAAITEVLAPDADQRLGSSLCRRALRESGADYAVRLRDGRSRGFLPLPRQGPLLVHRALGDLDDGPPPRHWHLTLGDVELF